MGWGWGDRTQKRVRLNVFTKDKTERYANVRQNMFLQTVILHEKMQKVK